MRIWHKLYCTCATGSDTCTMMNMSGGKDKEEALQEEKEDEVLPEAAESNMSGVETDTKTACEC